MYPSTEAKGWMRRRNLTPAVEQPETLTYLWVTFAVHPEQLPIEIRVFLAQQAQQVPQPMPES